MITSNPSICPLCSSRKPRSSDLCKECRFIYGTNPQEWPEWLRFLINDNARWRRELVETSCKEAPLADYELDDEGNLAKNTRGHTSLLNPDPWR